MKSMCAISVNWLAYALTIIQYNIEEGLNRNLTETEQRLVARKLIEEMHDCGFDAVATVKGS